MRGPGSGRNGGGENVIFPHVYWLFVSLLKDIYSNPFPILKLIFFFFFYCWHCRVLQVYILNIIWYVIHRYFSHSVGCPFTMLMGSFDAQEFLIVLKSKMSIFPFAVEAIFMSMKLLPSWLSWPLLSPLLPLPSMFLIVLVLILGLRLILHFIHAVPGALISLFCMWVPQFSRISICGKNHLTKYISVNSEFWFIPLVSK